MESKNVEGKRISRGKAIRLKCLECSCGSSNEVKLCRVTRCPLYPFRFGTDPYREKRELTPEQREQMAQRLAAARAARSNSDGVDEFDEDVEMDDLSAED